MTDPTTMPEPAEGPDAAEGSAPEEGTSPEEGTAPDQGASSSSAGMVGEPGAGPEGYVPEGEAGGDGAEEPIEDKASPIRDAKLSEMQELVDERTNDLQRLHAEYSNYKKRVDRDRLMARQGGVETVILDLLPVLDSVEAAREHAELVGGFKLVADELEKITAKYGLETFGEVGEEFDPQIHEALMQMPIEVEIVVPTVSAVMQRGVKLNERVLRPARVGVANPE